MTFDLLTHKKRLDLEQYVTRYNRYHKPFIWMATAGSIFAKLERLCQRISEPVHWLDAERRTEIIFNRRRVPRLGDNTESQLDIFEVE